MEESMEHCLRERMMLFQAQRQSCKVGFKGNAETKMIRDRETYGKRETKRQKKETETKKESHPQHSKKGPISTATTNNCDQHDTSAEQPPLSCGSDNKVSCFIFLSPSHLYQKACATGSSRARLHLNFIAKGMLVTVFALQLYW